MPEIDKEKAEVYKILSEIFYKGLFVVAAIVAFFMVLCAMLYTKEEAAVKVIYVVAELLLGGTVFLAFRHYFPDKKSD